MSHDDKAPGVQLCTTIKLHKIRARNYHLGLIYYNITI